VIPRRPPTATSWNCETLTLLLPTTGGQADTQGIHEDELDSIEVTLLVRAMAKAKDAYLQAVRGGASVYQ
jgi:hypothetical protein